MKDKSVDRTSHDRKVRQIARELKNQGWNVKADVRGYKKPTPIGKDRKRPDVEASKAGNRRIVEVETPRSLVDDKRQISTFVRHAAQKKRTSVDIVVTKPRAKKSK